MKYRYTGEDEKHFPSLGVLVKPGETIETDEDVNHPELEPVEEKHKKHSKAQEGEAQQEK